MLLALLVACDADSPEPAPAVVPYCESDIAYVYEPEAALTTFPDDHWTVADSSTATGLRVRTPPDHPAFAAFPDTYSNLLDQLGTLDGFGLTPAVVLQFARAVPEGAEVRLLVQEDGAWVARDTTVTPFEYGRSLSITPWRPLLVCKVFCIGFYYIFCLFNYKKYIFIYYLCNLIRYDIIKI